MIASANRENDAIWIQKLHSFGLLNSSYLPDSEQESLRTLVRYKDVLTHDSSRFVNRIQQSLELINIKFHTVIRDITGVSGLAVLRAILAGERNPENLLLLIDYRVKANKEVILKSLQGTWQAEDLFTLQQSLEMYECFRAKVCLCETEIEKYLQKMEARQNEGEIKDKQEMVCERKVLKNSKMRYKNSPKIPVREYLERIHGVDILSIFGLSDNAGLTLLAETGTDLSKWANENKFVGCRTTEAVESMSQHQNIGG